MTADNYAKNGGPGEVWLLCSLYHESLRAWIKTIVNKFAISNRTALILSVPALRSYLKLTCEYELHSLPNKKVSGTKDHGKNYIKVKPPLVRHLLRNRLFHWPDAIICLRFGFPIFADEHFTGGEGNAWVTSWLKIWGSFICGPIWFWPDGKLTNQIESFCPYIQELDDVIPIATKYGQTCSLEMKGGWESELLHPVTKFLQKPMHEVCKLIWGSKLNSWLITSACGLRAINDNYLQPILYTG